MQSVTATVAIAAGLPVALAAAPFKPTDTPNMNGLARLGRLRLRRAAERRATAATAVYPLTATPGQDTSLFPKQYRDYKGGVESFDVYSGNITRSAMVAAPVPGSQTRQLGLALPAGTPVLRGAPVMFEHLAADPYPAAHGTCPSAARSLYSQVWWKPLPPVALPADIVQRYAGQGMAIVGFEADQVMQTPDGEVSVPISCSYNHHYVTIMSGAKTRFVETQFDGPEDPRIANMHGPGQPSPAHGVNWREPNWVLESVDGKDAAPGDLPTSQLFDGANGGEYRMSFHGVSPQHAIVVDSPTQLQVTPMQIDTWNRDKMAMPTVQSPLPPKFVPGPLPRASLAPEDADYSGLLEVACWPGLAAPDLTPGPDLIPRACPPQCPITTRITKQVDGGYLTQGSGTCSTPVMTPAECYHAAATTVAGGCTFTNSSGSDSTRPTGCSITSDPGPGRHPVQLPPHPPADPSHHLVYFNSANSSVACAAGAVTVSGSTQSLVKISLSLDKSAVRFCCRPCHVLPLLLSTQAALPGNRHH
eukprot:gene9300-1674_t